MDQEGVGQGVRAPPLKNHKNIYWSGSPEKSQNYKASIQSWAIIGVSLGADDGLLFVVFGSSHQL